MPVGFDLPRTPAQRRELDGHRVGVFALVNARAPLAVLLDAVRQVAPAEGLGVEQECGVDVFQVGAVVTAVLVDGSLELELTRFGGHLNTCQRRCHDAEIT